MPGITPSEIIYQQQHIRDDRSSDVVGASITMAVLAAAAVTLRFLSRKQTKVAISHDDYFMLSALVFALGLCFLVGYGTHFGTGRHLLAVGVKNTQKYLQLAYAFQIVYGFTLVCVRLSILLFYRRLFPKESTPTWWRACVYGVTVLTVGGFIAGLGAYTFACAPISYFWTRTGKGHCVNEMVLIYCSAAVTIILDVFILLLPMPIVWSLQMQRGKKIGVMAVFLLGGFACLASIIRMFYIHEIVVLDPTWTQVNPAIWSTVEPCIGIVSACLPIIGPAVRAQMGSSTVRAPSWLHSSWLYSRSKRSGRGSSYAVKNSADRRANISNPMVAAHKPVVSATVYATKGSQSDEEMAVPLREMHGVGR